MEDKLGLVDFSTMSVCAFPLNCANGYANKLFFFFCFYDNVLG